jgi:hypothetical protein
VVESPAIQIVGTLAEMVNAVLIKHAMIGRNRIVETQ